MKVYHHTDMDGKCAGYVVHKFHPQMIEDHPSDYILTDYGDKFDKHDIRDDVVIVDVSFTEDTFNSFVEICNSARSVTWIDHHKSSLEMIAAHKDELQAISNLTYFVSDVASGTALTYAYFNIDSNMLKEIRDIEDDEEYSITAEYQTPVESIGKDKKIDLLKVGDHAHIKVTLKRINKKNPTQYSQFDKKIMLPSCIAFVDDYDAWKELYEESNYFKLSYDAMPYTTVYKNSEDPKIESLIFNDQFYELLFTDRDFLNAFINGGRNIYAYLMSTYVEQLPSTFEWTYKGTKFLCKNGVGNSWNFCDWIKRYPAAILFNYDGKSGKWDYSVYSDESSDFDCSTFCQSFGGGGHKHASGFQIEDLIFTKYPDEAKKAE